MNPIQHIAKLLRTPEAVLADLFAKMEKATGKGGVAEKIFEENKKVVKQKLADLGIPEDKADAQYVEREILKKTKEADEAFFEFLGKPDFSKPETCQKMIQIVEEVKPGKESGFFLREGKLRDFLFLNPPKNILETLGYKDVKTMLEKEDFYEIFAALRFMEDERWLNRVFFRPYNDLSAEYFEGRDIKVKMLSEKWAEIAEKFVGKKLHNISHLKELGLVFILPMKKDNFPGQTIETFSLVLHYLYEIDFYSKLFKKYSGQPDFGVNLVKLLSGAIVGQMPPAVEGVNWRIVVRYLAKLDENDPRLFEPHVNPETIHWLKAEKVMDELSQRSPEAKLDFWRQVDDYVGEIFPAGKRGEEIISFDLLDNVLSLTHGGLGKYLYHQQEALWNKIFIEYMGEEKIGEMVVDNLEKGYIEVK